MLGFFSASSIWPFAMTCGVAVIGYGIAFWHLWMIVAGAVILIWAATKLNPAVRRSAGEALTGRPETR